MPATSTSSRHQQYYSSQPATTYQPLPATSSRRQETSNYQTGHPSPGAGSAGECGCGAACTIGTGAYRMNVGRAGTDTKTKGRGANNRGSMQQGCVVNCARPVAVRPYHVCAWCGVGVQLYLSFLFPIFFPLFTPTGLSLHANWSLFTPTDPLSFLSFAYLLAHCCCCNTTQIGACVLAARARGRLRPSIVVLKRGGVGVICHSGGVLIPIYVGHADTTHVSQRPITLSPYPIPLLLSSLLLLAC